MTTRLKVNKNFRLVWLKYTQNHTQKGEKFKHQIKHMVNTTSVLYFNQICKL